MRWKPLMAAVVVALLLEPAAPSGRKQSGPRPPLWKDDDMSSIPEPAEYQDTLHYDFLHSTFGQAPRDLLGQPGHRQPAWNVNAWDEAPDSSWYTNRNHLRPMTVEEIRRGANQGPGPDLSGPLVVMRGKTAGTSPGFGPTRDARGNTYFIKFDSAEHPEISTAAEVIGARFFHAMGFYVAQEWIIPVRPDQFQIHPEARIWDQTGRRRRMTQQDVEEVLKGVARLPDGRIRTVASLLLPGSRGQFQFYGTRKDDPNDLIPHQHRRELRGLRLLCAWLNHYDIRVGNTLDSYVEEGGRKFLRHYLLDFGSTLGSASFFPKAPRMGNSYIFDLEEILERFFTLGLYQPPWRARPAPVSFPSVGPLEGATFSPADWKPVFPVASFACMDGADAFWAAKVVMSFTEEQIRAAVEEGQLSDPRAAEFLVRALIERQRKIGSYAFSLGNPLDRFQISQTGRELEFQDLALRYGFADPGGTWCYYTFDGKTRSSRSPRIPLDGLNPKEKRFALILGARRAAPGFAEKRVLVYLERGGSGFRVLGWEREQ